jgi:HAD superfamily hydrolase (TIGR01549 family)
MEHRLILIDYDGTIVDSRKFHEWGLIEFLNHEKIKFKKTSIPKLLGEKTSEILKQFKVNKTKAKAIFDEVNEEKLEHLNKIKLIKQSNFFKELSKKNKVIIISNAEKKFLKSSTKRLNIDHFFKDILGDEDFKDKSDGIKKMLKKYRISPKQAVYIGDRYSDVIYGKKAGVVTIAVSNKYSWSSRSDLLKQNPDFIINDLSDLKKIIG